MIFESSADEDELEAHDVVLKAALAQFQARSLHMHAASYDYDWTDDDSDSDSEEKQKERKELQQQQPSFPAAVSTTELPPPPSSSAREPTLSHAAVSRPESKAANATVGCSPEEGRDASSPTAALDESSGPLTTSVNQTREKWKGNLQGRGGAASLRFATTAWLVGHTRKRFVAAALRRRNPGHCSHNPLAAADLSERGRPSTSQNGWGGRYDATRDQALPASPGTPPATYSAHVMLLPPTKRSHSPRPAQRVAAAAVADGRCPLGSVSCHDSPHRLPRAELRRADMAVGECGSAGPSPPCMSYVRPSCRRLAGRLPHGAASPPTANS